MEHKQNLKTDGKVDLGNYFEYLEETAGELRLADVVHRSNRSRWRTVSPHGLAFGPLSRPLWLRARIYNPLSSEQYRVLDINFPLSQSLDIYVQRKLNRYEQSASLEDEAEGLENLSALAIVPRNLHLPMILASQEELTVYFRVDPVAALNFSAFLWESEKFRENSKFEYATKSFAFGLIFAVLFFCVVKFYRRYDSVLGYLLAYLLAISGLLMTLSGAVSELFRPGDIVLENQLLIWSLCACASFGALFTQVFLRLENMLPGSWRWTMVLLFASVLGVLSNYVLSGAFALQMLVITLLAVAVYALVTGLIVSLRKNTAALLFTAAWCFMLCASVLLAICFAVGVHSTWPVETAVFIAATSQAVLFALAVLEREQSRLKQRQRRQLDALMAARMLDQRHSNALESERLARIAEHAELENQIHTNEALERRVMQLSRELSKSYRELQRLGDIDTATGLRNRNFCLCNLADAIDDYRRSSSEFSLILVDFKLSDAVSDCPDSREESLRKVGRTLQYLLPQLKETDFSYIGGGRFAVILHGVGSHDINLIAQKLFNDLKDLQADLAGKQRNMAVSGASVASFESPTPESLLQAAERALKASKFQSGMQVFAEFADSM